MADDARSEEIKALCRGYAEDMVGVLAEVARDSTEKGAARVAAARTLLERGFGAPERKVETKVDVTVHDHRQAHLQALRKLSDGRNPVNDIVEDIEDAEIIEHVPAKIEKGK